MALTVNKNAARGLNTMGYWVGTVFDVTGDNAYPAGGWPMTPQQLKLGAIEWMANIALVNAARSGSLMGIYDIANAKLQVFAGGAGEFAYTPGDLLGATKPAGTEENADQAAGPVNPAKISALVTFTAAAGTVPITIAAPDIPRNVIITIDNTTGGSLDLFQGVTTFTVTGKFRGQTQTELITFTSSSGNKAVAAAKFRYKAGVKPFERITSITYDNAAAGALSIEVGLGTAIGFPAQPATNTDADIQTFAVTGVPVTIAGASDFTNQTINTGTTADAWDLNLVYLVAGAETSAGTDLSGYTGRGMAVGKG